MASWFIFTLYLGRLAVKVIGDESHDVKWFLLMQLQKPLYSESPESGAKRAFARFKAQNYWLFVEFYVPKVVGEISSKRLVV